MHSAHVKSDPTLGQAWEVTCWTYEHPVLDVCAGFFLTVLLGDVDSTSGPSYSPYRSILST